MIPTMNEKEARELIDKNYVVVPYPRKNIVVVSGFKRYNASESLCKLIKELIALK